MIRCQTEPPARHLIVMCLQLSYVSSAANEAPFHGPAAAPAWSLTSHCRRQVYAYCDIVPMIHNPMPHTALTWGVALGMLPDVRLYCLRHPQLQCLFLPQYRQQLQYASRKEQQGCNTRDAGCGDWQLTCARQASCKGCARDSGIKS
jgi:hypothetical protein